MSLLIPSTVLFSECLCFTNYLLFNISQFISENKCNCQCCKGSRKKKSIDNLCANILFLKFATKYLKTFVTLRILRKYI